MIKPEVIESLSPRKFEVLKHYLDVMITIPENVEYFEGYSFANKDFPVDIVVIPPSQLFDYYVVGTVGLSEFRMNEKVANAEILMVLPDDWKPVLDNEKFCWVFDFLRDISYSAITGEAGVLVGQVYVLNEEGKPYTTFNDAVGGILCFPEMFPFVMYEKLINDTYTRFYQVVTIDNKELGKIEEMGPYKYIQFALHDSEKPLMVCKLKDKPLQGIDKIIKENEDALKGKKSKK